MSRPTLLFLGILVIASPAPAQTSSSASAIDDKANLFSRQAKEKALKSLQNIEKQSGIPVVIDTIRSTEGEPVNSAALERAKALDSHGLYLLIAQKERDVSRPLVYKDHADRFPEQVRSEIRQAVIDHFEKGDFDGGLIAAEERIGKALGVAGAARPATAGEGHSSLIQRGGIKLTLEGAQLAIKGAKAKAEEMGLKMNIAVVDDGGHLVAFARMNGARAGSGYTAMAKAVTSATFRRPSGPIKHGDGAPDLLLNLSLQNAASAGGGTFSGLYGGVPIEVEGQIIGAVGCGGGTGEQDAECSRAGIAKLLEQLKQAEAEK